MRLNPSGARLTRTKVAAESKIVEENVLVRLNPNGARLTRTMEAAEVKRYFLCG